METKIFNKNFILLMVINTLLFIGFNMVNPILPGYCDSLGISLSLAGVVSGCFSITALVFRPLSGMAADKFNPKMLYILAGAMMSIASLLYIFCSGFASLIIVRIFHGIFFAVDSTLSLVMVTHFIPKDKFGEGIGYFGIGPIIGISFAPGLGIQISRSLGHNVSFMIAAGTTLLATFLLCALKYNHAKAKQVKRKRKRESYEKTKHIDIRQYKGIRRFIATEVLLLAILSGFYSFANSIEYTFMDLYSKAQGIEDISIYFTVSAAFILATRLFAGKIYDKKGLDIIFYPAFGFGVISMIILGRADCLWMFLLAAALKALGQGSAQPSIQSKCMASVPIERRGLASSTYYLGPDIMQGIGPVVGGIISEYLGYQFMYYSCSGLMLVGVLLYWIWSRKQAPAD